MKHDAEHQGLNGTVLVIDDDVVFRTVLSDMLHDQGFRVEYASNADQALDKTAACKPDIVVIDTRIGGASGFDICRDVQQHRHPGSLPVLMTIDRNNIADIERAFDAGAMDFTSKPVDYAVLIKRLQFILRASQKLSKLNCGINMFKAIHRIAGLGFWRLDNISGQFEVSEQLARMCLLEAGHEYKLSDYEQCIISEDRELFQKVMHNVLQNHEAGSVEYQLHNRNGGTVLVRQDIDLRHHIGCDNIILGAVQDISSQKAAEEQIRKMAYFDALTGLASRSYFMQHLNESIISANRHNQKLSLLFLDLDGFKDINDTLGHNVGDFLLTAIARRLRSALRDSDFIARLGGDEFCVLLSEYEHHSEVAKVAEKCLQAINETIELASREYNPKVSIGIANYPADASSMHDLLKAADSAMYAAKQDGKHRYAFYDPEMTAQAEQRMTLEMELKHAFANQEFELHYQPQISFIDGRMVGVEALTRWNHPHRGLIAPDQFIPVLEQMGLISDLGEWVISQACEQAQRWKQQGLGQISIAVNISPQHFSDGSLAATVTRALAKYHIRPELLEIEITESMVQTSDDILSTFEELKHIGVTIAIDDFGTGYSSLGSLKNLPIDCLKIDRLFVRDLAQHTDDNIMLGTIFGMAHALDYKVVAEGVETEEQALILAGLGCDLAQGYLYSKPVPAEEIPSLYFSSFQPLLNSTIQAKG